MSPDRRHGFLITPFAEHWDLADSWTIDFAVLAPWNPPTSTVAVTCDITDGAGNFTSIEIGRFDIAFTAPTIVGFQVEQFDRWGGNTLALRGTASANGPLPPGWYIGCTYFGPGSVGLGISSRDGLISEAIGGDYPPGTYTIGPAGCLLGILSPDLVWSRGPITVAADALPPGVQRSITVF